MDGGRGGEADRLGDLADGRRIAARADRRRDHVEDLPLAFGVVTGQRRLLSRAIIPNVRSMSTRAGARRRGSLGPAARLAIPVRRADACTGHERRDEETSAVAQAAYDGPEQTAQSARSTRNQRIGLRRLRRLGRVPAAGEPRPDLRPPVLGARPRRPDAGGPQGAAGRGARLPRPRPRPHPRRHPDRRRPRRPRRRRARRRPVPRRRPDGRARREARRCWASTGGRSCEDVARIRRFTPGPLRRALRGAPRAVAFAGDTLDHSRIGPRVRTWINKEDSIA